jgi:hypothetical protein
MEGGVEYGNLRQARELLHGSANAQQVSRVMQRCQFGAFLDFGDDGVVDDCGGLEVLTMHHTMANGLHAVQQIQLTQAGNDGVHGSSMVGFAQRLAVFLACMLEADLALLQAQFLGQAGQDGLVRRRCRSGQISARNCRS